MLQVNPEMLTLTNFQPDGNSGNYTTTFTLDTKVDDGMDAENGVISVVLDTPESGDGYTIGTMPNDRVTINVKDGTVPTITIEDANDVTAGSAASFTLTADTQPWQALTIRYTPNESGSNFLAPAGGTSGTPTSTTTAVLFTDTNGSPPITGTLSIPTVAGTPNTTGTINIELLGDSDATDPSYMITGNQASNTKSVEVSSYPVVQLSLKESTVNIDEGGMATITVTANENPFRTSLPIKFTPTDSTGTYLKTSSAADASGESRDVTLTNFQQVGGTSEYSTTFTVDTKDDDGIDAENGVISVV